MTRGALVWFWWELPDHCGYEETFPKQELEEASKRESSIQAVHSGCPIWTP